MSIRIRTSPSSSPDEPDVFLVGSHAVPRYLADAAAHLTLHDKLTTAMRVLQHPPGGMNLAHARFFCAFLEDVHNDSSPQRDYVATPSAYRAAWSLETLAKLRQGPAPGASGEGVAQQATERDLDRVLSLLFGSLLGGQVQVMPLDEFSGTLRSQATNAAAPTANA